jgi:prevent-host-death family protein
VSLLIDRLESVMHEVGAFEAKNKLSTLLDGVEHGEEVVITRHGKAVARLVPAAPSFDQARARQAAANIRSRRAGATLNGLKIKDLVNEGLNWRSA